MQRYNKFLTYPNYFVNFLIVVAEEQIIFFYIIIWKNNNACEEAVSYVDINKNNVQHSEHYSIFLFIMLNIININFRLP